MNIKKNVEFLIHANKQALKHLVRNKKLDLKTSVDYNKLYDEVHEKSSPCFVLSTGRCGTHLLTKLLSKHKKLDVYHEPTPQLIYYSKYAFENTRMKKDELKLLVDGARYEYIRNSYLLDLHFVETNNRITFFAHQLAELYPNSKFIHLVRNPISFVKSGLNRDWYTGRNAHDEGRIKKNDDQWNSFSASQKVAWLWENTNRFVEEFKNAVDDNRHLTIRSEDLFGKKEIASSIFDFIGTEPISPNLIEKTITKPTNVSRSKSDSSVKEKTKEEISGLVGLAEKYDYSVK